MAYMGQSILAVVPARGGSKGIPKKNLLRLGGRSLVAHASSIAQSLSWIDRSIISTDDPELLQEGISNGLDAPFLRPHTLSGDYASSLAMWQHALLESEIFFETTFDVSILLEPTSPFRRPEHIKSTVEKLIVGQYDSVFTVSQTDSKQHPMKQLVITDNKVKYYETDGNKITARQELKDVYHKNGIVYAITRECLVEHRDLINQNSSTLLIEDPTVNIDTEWDFRIAEWLFEQRKRQD